VGTSLERRGYLNGRPVRNSDHHRIYSLSEKAVEYLREYPEA
jgi:DNA-binding PadR family transcriptional regulator